MVTVCGVKIRTMAGSSDEDILLRLQDQTLTQKVFITMFDVLCKGRFFSCLAQWNNYSKELVEHEDFDRFVDAAEHRAFPDQWRVLSSLRDINKYRTQAPHIIQFKKRQVFFQLLSLLRMSNPRLLSWWAMIQSVFVLFCVLAFIFWWVSSLRN